MRPCGILVFAIVISWWFIAEQTEYPQSLKIIRKLKCRQSEAFHLRDIIKWHFIDFEYSQKAKTVQWSANMIESKAMAFYQSFVLCCVIAGTLRKTRLSQSFGKMLRTLLIRTLHSDQWVGNNKCHPVSDLVSRRKMIQSLRLKRAAHGKPALIWSNLESHLELMWRLPQRWQTKWNKINDFTLIEQVTPIK